LGLKNYGESNVQKSSEGMTRFMSFGSINYTKHIDLLIDAAEGIYEKGYKNFIVVIKGGCSNPESIMSHVKHPELFDLSLRPVDNLEIADLFCSSHFFVQPYRVVSQSGPFKIAMKYNIPLITSDLPGFTDEMVDNVTGYTFETNSLQSLEDRMIQCIKMVVNGKPYEDLCKRMTQYVTREYSEAALLQRYCDMFNEVINT